MPRRKTPGPSPLRGRTTSAERAARTAREQAKAQAAGFGSAYEQRLARGRERGLSRSVAGGKPTPREVPLSSQHLTFYSVPVRIGSGTVLVDIETRNLRGGSVLGAYLADIGALLRGRLTAAEFEARWQRRTVAGHRLESRAAFVVEAMRSRGPQPGEPRYRRVAAGAGGGSR